MYLPTQRSYKDWRPYGKWIFVKADPRVKKTAGGIYLTDEITGIERVMEGTGKVLKIGPEVEKTVGYKVAEGDRIVFRGFLKDAFHEFKDEDECRVFMLRAEDVIALIGDDVSMGAFSSPKEDVA
jgi:co-chaperonin GroES (HSP10)